MASKTKDGTWRVSVRIGTRRVSKHFPTKALAVDYEAKIRLGKASPEVPRSAVTFGAYADTWLKSYSALEKAKSSQLEDGWAVRLYIKPLLGEKKLAALMAKDLTAFKLELKAKMDEGKLSAKSANNILGCTKKIMRTAVAHGLRSSYPWDGVKNFKLPERDFKFWTVEEGKRFYEAARFRNREMADLVLFAMNTGLRLGELKALTWEAVDLPRGVVTVKATYNVQLKETFERTKNRRVGRVPLNDEARKVLDQRKGRSYDGLVFDPNLCRDTNAVFRRLQRAVGMPTVIRFHDLRHSFASNLVAAGVEIYTVQKLMRHATLAMTERYAHLRADFLGNAVEKLSGTDLVRQSGGGQ